MFFILRKIAQGQSLARVLMNLSFKKVVLSGVVVDVGGARHPDYFSYFNTSAVSSITPIDGSLAPIDFEKDPLPYSEACVDTVVLCNVLEHMFNYRFLLTEISRILRPKGMLVGFVPFMVNYHPDPHDYFRYTHEALHKLFSEAGFTDIHIEPIGGSALYVNFNNIMLSFPQYIRPILFLPYVVCNKVFVWFRPHIVNRYPLGYTFYAKKTS